MGSSVGIIRRDDMSVVKDAVLNLVQEFPESTTLDDILAEIYFKA